MIIQSPKQSDNDLGHAVERHDAKALGGTTIRAACESGWNLGSRHALTLLDMMRLQCAPDIREDFLAKTNRDRGLLLTLESLWQSLGCPKSELWQRLHVYLLDNDSECPSSFRV
jgi:hypothetical protein